MNKVAVSNYELGKRTPDLATIRKIADALCVNIGRLTESYGDEVVVEHGAFRKHLSLIHIYQRGYNWLSNAMTRMQTQFKMIMEGVWENIPDTVLSSNLLVMGA